MNSYEIKFGYDEMVATLNPLAPAGTLVKIGHVALFQQAIISGEIRQVGNAWELDNNSGAWGAMGDRDDKSAMMALVAKNIGDMVPNFRVTALRAYSRSGWKRAIQQLYR